MTLSVIIVTWNTCDLTGEAVRSLLAQQVDADLDLIVVDNGSTDGTVATLRDRFPAVRVIPTGRNLGFAGGNNVGLRRARGDWTLLLNSDTSCRPGALQALLDVARARPDAAAIQPRLILPDGSIQWTWNYQPSLLAELGLPWRARAARTRWWQRRVAAWREPREVVAVGLAALLVPRWVWQRIGLLATEPFLFFEEADLSARIHRRGWPLLYVPAAEIEHHVGASMAQVPLVKRRAHYLSRLWYYQTHTRPVEAEALRWLTLARAAWGGLAADRAEWAELWRPVWERAVSARRPPPCTETRPAR